MISRGEAPKQILEIDEYVFSIYSDDIKSIEQIKYRKKDNNTKLGWGRIKSCKDVFWTIDILKRENSNFSNVINDLYIISMKLKNKDPLKVFTVNGEYIFGIYNTDSITSIKQVKYRKKDNNTKLGWTRIKSCKNVFWTIDMLKRVNSHLSNIINDLYIISMKLKNKDLLKVFTVNGEYILGIYQGSISEYDLLIKYRQKEGDKWSNIRTPKHIHWAVDILIKMSLEENKTKEFLGFLINYWDDNVTPLTTEEDRNSLLSDELLNEVNNEATQYPELVEKGEYNVKFLLLIAKLLMFQEKTNLDTAYMFKNLLKELKEGKDIFKIVSIATHNRR
jgi:hypothetical protein